MDNGIWNMQQEARIRVATQRAREHRVAEEQNRRTAATLRAARPPVSHPPAPPPPPPAPPAPVKPAADGEQIMLLVLALLLSQSGASRMLVLAILYLAM